MITTKAHFLQRRGWWRRSTHEWFVALPTFVLLMAVLMISMGELVHSQMLQIGESMFGDRIKQVQYFALRADPTPPSCQPDIDVEREVARLINARSATPAKDEFDALIKVAPLDEAQLRQSLASAKALCQAQFQIHRELIAHLTPEVRAYRAVEQAFFDLFHFGTASRTTILLALLGVAMLATAVRHEHIVLTAPRYQRDFWMQSVTTAIGAAFLLWSACVYYRLSVSGGGVLEREELHIAWIVLFAAMLAVSVWRCWQPCSRALQAELGTWRHAFKTIPLGSIMAVVAGLYYALQGHPAGLAIHVHSLMEVPSLSLHLALFIWCGMLFKQSRVVDLFMNLLRPWRLSPEVLSWVILLASAVPTAYTGGSGVFVVAAGALIYHEVRDAGGSHQYALAATAMSGSLGMVLRPSLLVVAIVAMNRNVTSQELFYWGWWVLALTTTLFLVTSLMRRQRTSLSDLPGPKLRQAFPAMLTQVPPLMPHVAVAMAVIGFFSVVLDTRLNETSAPLIMPMIVVLVLLFDKLMLAQGIGPLSPRLAHAMKRERSFEGSVRVATSETASHLGGYIYLIILSQALGGVVERAGLGRLSPDVFATPWSAMAFLAMALVILGMFMEPLGAVFLVSTALSPIAASHGIDPIHFWIVVLVAFELGYLMPPVALNQLLARQVIGQAALVKADAQERSIPSFYRRHEQWILPCGVMSVALVVVAFLPLFTHGMPSWLLWMR